MEDWTTALIGFLGVILGIGIQEYRRWMESKEEYQRMIFLKRLDAHQKAFEWCHILNRELNGGNPDKIHDVANKFREWLDANCLYLDRKSPNVIVPLTNYAHQYARGQRDTEVFTYLNKAFKSIVEGIGVEYLPKELREASVP